MGLQPHKSLSHNVVDDHAGGWYFLRVTPTRIANSKFMAIACIVVGALLLVVSLGTGQAVSAVAGGILLLLGILQMINPQLVITAINPGTMLTLVYGAYSIWLVKRYESTRAGALGLFTCFLCGFLVLTVIGTYFRGPNWEFFWSPADWPGH